MKEFIVSVDEATGRFNYEPIENNGMARAVSQLKQISEILKNPYDVVEFTRQLKAEYLKAESIVRDCRAAIGAMAHEGLLDKIEQYKKLRQTNFDARQKLETKNGELKKELKNRKELNLNRGRELRTLCCVPTGMPYEEFTKVIRQLKADAEAFRAMPKRSVNPSPAVDDSGFPLVLKKALEDEFAKRSLPALMDLRPSTRSRGYF